MKIQLLKIRETKSDLLYWHVQGRLRLDNVNVCRSRAAAGLVGALVRQRRFTNGKRYHWNDMAIMSQFFKYDYRLTTIADLYINFDQNKYELDPSMGFSESALVLQRRLSS